MPKKGKFSQTVKFDEIETKIAEIETGYDPALVDEEQDGLFETITYKDGSKETKKHKRCCPWGGEPC